jgi:hypothetical protein
MSHKKALEKILFLEIEEQEKKEKEKNPNYSNIKTYVIVDAAKIKKLTNELIALTSLKYENLFMPYEQEQLEEVAPYLIELKKEDEFTTWVYENVYGKQGAMFIHSTQNIEELSEHLRPYITTTTNVPNPKNETELIEVEAYMRLYDPRVFPRFIKKLKDYRSSFFLNIETIYVENKKEQNELVAFKVEEEKVISLVEERE